MSIVELIAHHPHHGKVRVTVGNLGVSVFIPGYGDHVSDDGHGEAIFIDLWSGLKHPVVHIWGDINQEDPTHDISLKGAQISKRRD